MYIAKAELSKVRQSRSFELSTINIQDPGQEKWKKKEGDSQGPVGCANGHPGAGRMGDENGAQGLGVESSIADDTPEEYSCFFIDTKPVNPWDCGPVYERDISDILGESPDDIRGANPDVRRCFNCGETEHAVAQCLAPINHALVALSRQMFVFSQSAHRQALGDLERIHIVEGRRQQQLDFLDAFEPGEVRGDLLRDAISDNGEEWLKNMALWGYPRGWTGPRDPRYEVMKRIEEEPIHDEEPVFLIFGDGGEEEVELYPQTTDSAESEDGEDVHLPLKPDESAAEALMQIHRWAAYPDTYFSSALLPIYNGFALPPPESDTFSRERQALWEKITSAPPPPPPPPTTSPPPLPPFEPPPIAPLASEVPQPCSLYSDGEAEMDFSDED
ncbi:hypothetical protein HWV62_41932 [Athelia sp. TMB]|nr:hypothetical protein HWV62_41932 [Athelia sp. TMB]